MRTRGIFLVFVCVLAALAASGCRRRTAVRGVVSGGGEGGGGRGGSVAVGGGVVASGTPQQQLEQLDQVLRSQGYQPVGPATHAQLAPFTASSVPIDVRRGHCYTIAVFGNPGSDVNLI